MASVHILGKVPSVIDVLKALTNGPTLMKHHHVKAPPLVLRQKSSKSTIRCPSYGMPLVIVRSIDFR